MFQANRSDRPALVLALAYTYAQENRGKKATFYVITFPIQWLPYAIMLMTLVSAGTSATLIQGSGLIAAHLYDFLTRLYPTFGGGRNYITTPGFVRRWFATGRLGPITTRYGTVFAPRSGETRIGSSSSLGSSSGRGGGGISSLWNRRGPGRRLGDN